MNRHGMSMSKQGSILAVLSISISFCLSLSLSPSRNQVVVERDIEERACATLFFFGLSGGKFRVQAGKKNPKRGVRQKNRGSWTIIIGRGFIASHCGCALLAITPLPSVDRLRYGDGGEDDSFVARESRSHWIPGTGLAVSEPVEIRFVYL